MSGGVGGSDEVVPLTKPATVDVVDQLHLLAKYTKNEVLKMTNKKKVKKIQISIPVEQYQKMETMWLGLGFSSVAEAGKFLLMNNVAEFYKQVRKSQTAITKLQNLKESSKSSNAEVALVQPKNPQTGKAAPASQQTSGYITKGSFEYRRVISEWRKQNPNFNEPDGIKGLRWWIDETTEKKNVGWWKHGGK